MHFLKNIKITVLSFSLLAFIGCGTKITTPEKVFIPVKCKTSVPERPVHTTYENDIINILSYTEQLEKVVDVCVEKE